MRFGLIVLAGSLVAFCAGCRDHINSNPVIASSNPVTHDPVGPIPGGGAANVSYSTDPYDGNPVALQAGRRLFVWYNCAGCHGGRAGGGMGPSLRDPKWIFGNRDDQIFDSIAEGRGEGMPAWGTKIPTEQIWELVAYIKSLNTPNEPDPPTEPKDEDVGNPQHFVSNTGQGTQIFIESKVKK